MKYTNFKQPALTERKLTVISLDVVNFEPVVDTNRCLVAGAKLLAEIEVYSYK